MLTYKNKQLSYDNELITSNDYILTLDTDIFSKEVIILGKLQFANGLINIIQFTSHDEGLFKARLNLSEEVKPYLANSTFNLILIDGSLSETSNLITFKFNEEQITFALKASKSKELEDLRIKLGKLESSLDHLIKGHVISGINIKNTSYIKPGMILQAVDSKGNFIAVYPFQDVVKEVNGQKAINSSIILDATMIQYNQERTVAEQLSRTTLSIQTVMEMFKAQGTLINALQQEVLELKNKIDTHLNDGIV